MRLVFSLMLMLSCMATYASKDKGVYVGAGVNLVGVGAEDIYRNGVTFKVGEIFLGYKYNPFLGVEARYGAGFNEEIIAYDENEESGLPAYSESGIDHFYSLYYRAELANEIAKVYFLLGQSQMQTTSVFEDDSELVISDSSVSYGIGFGLWLDERMNLNFEYKKLVDTDTDSFTSGSINADYRF